MRVSECCLIKLFPYILFEKYINILALEMASPGNRHCANCIGTLSFPIVGDAENVWRYGTVFILEVGKLNWTDLQQVDSVTQTHAEFMNWSSVLFTPIRPLWTPLYAAK